MSLYYHFEINYVFIIGSAVVGYFIGKLLTLKSYNDREDRILKDEAYITMRQRSCEENTRIMDKKLIELQVREEKARIYSETLLGEKEKFDVEKENYKIKRNEFKRTLDNFRQEREEWIRQKKVEENSLKARGNALDEEEEKIENEELRITKLRTNCLEQLQHALILLEKDTKEELLNKKYEEMVDENDE